MVKTKIKGITKIKDGSVLGSVDINNISRTNALPAEIITDRFIYRLLYSIIKNTTAKSRGVLEPQVANPPNVKIY
jgi:hypothetical protein